MIVSVNGDERELPPDATVTMAVGALGVAPETPGVAVALDGEVLPRAEWPRRALAPGARVEVVTAIQGG